MVTKATSPLQRALGYQKFAGPGPYRLLVPTSGYHLQQECVRALTNLGHTVHPVPIDQHDAGTTLKAILTAMVAFKPDALVVINHLGFDDGHQLGDVLNACFMPVACWYCDSPFFVLKNGGLPGAQMTSLFVWERTLSPILEGYGAKDVSHLPLAYDKALAAVDSQREAFLPPPQAVTFVGNSMRAACDLWAANLGNQERNYQTVWQQRLRAERVQLAADVAALQRSNPELALWDALGAATFTATRAYRDALLHKLCAQNLQIYGDEGWRGTVPRKVGLHAAIGYGPDLAALYRASCINLNATSLQMPTAVNQRVFDCPGAGGFLLSDAQQDMFELFDVGREAIVYHCVDELQSLVRYYRKKPNERQKVVRSARARIARCHTYEHRLKTMVGHMKQRYGNTS